MPIVIEYCKKKFYITFFSVLDGTFQFASLAMTGENLFQCTQSLLYHVQLNTTLVHKDKYSHFAVKEDIACISVSCVQCSESYICVPKLTRARCGYAGLDNVENKLTI